jgi:hypothetical protein
VDTWTWLGSDVHRVQSALGMDTYLMLFIGTRKYEDRITKINEQHRLFERELVRFESFHNEGTLKDMKRVTKTILRHIEVLENAFKRERQKQRSKKK